MVQEFMVLRCYSCQAFQVHQVKKAPKWNCKVCGENQSRKKVYGQGKATDCRKHVQKLNMLQGCVEDDRRTAKDQRENTDNGDDDDDGTFNLSACGSPEDRNDLVEKDESLDLVNSKWSKFITTRSPDPLEDEESAGFQVTTERVQFDNAVNGKRRKRERREVKKLMSVKRPVSSTEREEQRRNFPQSQQENVHVDAHVTFSGLRKRQNVSVADDELWKADTTSHKFGKEQTTTESVSSGLKSLHNCSTSTMGESLPRSSKWSKFLSAPARDKNGQQNRNESVPLNAYSQVHLPAGQNDSLSVQTSNKNIPQSAKFNAVFSIFDNDLEDEWLND